MKKTVISFDQLALLSFLKFAKLNGMDMTLLMKQISSIAEVELKDDSCDYFVMPDGTIMLERKYVEKFYKNVDIELLESMQGSAVKRYLNDIDMLEFVLRKIKLFGLGCLVKDEVPNSFSSLQIRIMNLLYQNKYIMEYCQEDRVYGSSYQAIKLTKRGELYLFLIDNEKEIDSFVNLLKVKGYDSLLLDAFLITQDLEKGAKEILSLDNFMSFCSEYDREPLALTEGNIYHKRARTKNI